ncbi:MAG: hypothetical protein AB7G75_28315 [Candidatus Binatia bacterium]
MDAESRTIWQLRILMGVGVLLLLSDLVERQSLGLRIPWLLSCYLIGASFYFAMYAQKMVLNRKEEMLTYMLFPGAFVTALVPAYTLFLFLVGFSD